MEKSYRRKHKHWLDIVACLWICGLAAFAQGNIATIPVLLSLTPGLDGTTAIVSGRTTANDGGGGVFTYSSASTASTNLGTIFKPNSANGRWLRQVSSPENVLWYGADKTGVSNSSAAIQNALDSLPSSGGMVFMPRGVYLLSGTGLSITTENVTLAGEGMSMEDNATPVASTRLNHTGTGSAITIGAAGPWSYGNFQHGVALSGFGITGNVGADNGILFDSNGATTYADRASVSDVSVSGYTGASSSGIRVNFAVSLEFNRVYTRNNKDGFKVVGGVCIDMNSVISRVNDRYGVVVGGGSLSVSDLSIEGQSVIESNVDAGFYLAATSTSNGTTSLRGVRFENNCTATGLNYQAYVAGSGANRNGNVVFNDVTFSTCNQLGDIFISYCNQASM